MIPFKSSYSLQRANHLLYLTSHHGSKQQSCDAALTNMVRESIYCFD